ncbi:MAG TPA: hypothetical protein VMJ33_12095 [Gallionella sp.]|nr:hypothetical protein [Gallionella sp.]
MKMQTVAICLGALLTNAALPAHAETAAPQPAQSSQPTHGACALVKAEDLKALMGEVPSYSSKKGSCTWTVAGKPTKLITTKFPDDGMAAEMAYYDIEKNASSGGPVISTKGLGDKGFARLNKIGVVLVTIKNGKLLQMVYATGAPGTEKDIEALKPVAMKVLEGF